VKREHPGKRIRVLFEDEARLGQQGTIANVWARRGSRPTVERQNGRKSAWVFGAVEPLTGRSISMVAKTANTFAMQEFLYGLSREIVRNDHAVLVLDRAGWHRSKHLVWPRNITPLFLPPYSPELDCIERVWQYSRQHYWSNRSFLKDSGTSRLQRSRTCRSSRRRRFGRCVTRLGSRASCYCDPYKVLLAERAAGPVALECGMSVDRAC